MANPNLQLCASCQHRLFSPRTGVTCALTKAKPDFEDECPTYLEKGAAANTPAKPAKPAAKKAVKKEDVTIIETATPKKAPKPAPAKPIQAPVAAPTPKPAPAPEQAPKPTPAKPKPAPAAPKPAPAAPVAAQKPVQRPMAPRQPRPSKPMPKEVTTLSTAMLHTLLTIAKLLFLTPYNIWMESAAKLENQSKDGSLNLKNVSGFWGILSFIKRILFDFSFNAAILLSFPIGVILFFVLIFKAGFVIALTTLLVTYFVVPALTLLTQDLIRLALIPLYKYVSWGTKPAQYLDVNEIKK